MSDSPLHAAIAQERARRAEASKSADMPMELSTTQVAKELGVSMGTVRRWCDRGLLAHSRTPGGFRRFSRGQIEAFLASCVRN